MGIPLGLWWMRMESLSPGMKRAPCKIAAITLTRGSVHTVHLIFLLAYICIGIAHTDRPEPNSI